MSNKIIKLIQDLNTGIRRISLGNAMILFMSILFAILLRLSLVDYKTLDFFTSLKPSYNAISSIGFSAFSTNFSTYNPPYLYLLYVIARLFTNMPAVIAVKLPALVADFICGYLVYRIVQTKYTATLLPLVAGMAVLFAPTVLLNSAFWGQADSLFTAGLLACIYFLMEKEHSLAFFYFGIAMAFKLQAIFMVPLLFAFFLKNAISWKYFLIIPVVLILALIPSWLAGRPILDLLKIYLYQYPQFQLPTINAASIYSWLPATEQVFNLLYIPGLLAGAIAGFFIVTIAYKCPNELSKSIIVELALLATLVIPFFLPAMHEQCFYPADIISIAFAFYYPEFFYIPILVGGVSFFSYQSFLFNEELVSLPILTLIVLIVIAILVYHTLLQLYSSNININDNLLSTQIQNDK
jgi:Gpi18-like mannosyltransferase